MDSMHGCGGVSGEGQGGMLDYTSADRIESNAIPRIYIGFTLLYMAILKTR